MRYNRNNLNLRNNKHNLNEKNNDPQNKFSDIIDNYSYEGI